MTTIARAAGRRLASRGGRSGGPGAAAVTVATVVAGAVTGASVVGAELAGRRARRSLAPAAGAARPASRQAATARRTLARDRTRQADRGLEGRRPGHEALGLHEVGVVAEIGPQLVRRRRDAGGQPVVVPVTRIDAMQRQVRHADRLGQARHQRFEVSGRQVDHGLPDAEHDGLLGMADPGQSGLLGVGQAGRAGCRTPA